MPFFFLLFALVICADNYKHCTGYQSVPPGKTKRFAFLTIYFHLFEVADQYPPHCPHFESPTNTLDFVLKYCTPVDPTISPQSKKSRLCFTIYPACCCPLKSKSRGGGSGRRVTTWRGKEEKERDVGERECYVYRALSRTTPRFIFVFFFLDPFIFFFVSYSSIQLQLSHSLSHIHT